MAKAQALSGRNATDMFSLDSPIGFNGLPNMNRRLWTPRNAFPQWLTLWLRSDLGIAQSGGVVSRWADQSGRGNDFTASGTAQPAYTAIDSAVANRPSLTWDGTNNVMTGPALSSLVTATDYTIFAVFVAEAIDTNTATIEQNDAIISDGDGGAGGFFGIHLRSTPNVNVYNWDGSRDFAAAAISTNTATIVTARHGAGTLGVRVNGGAEVTTASGTTTTLTHAVALGRGWSNAFFKGRLAQLIILNTWPGEGVASQFRTYLSNSYLLAL